jgi:hypothetical protein
MPVFGENLSGSTLAQPVVTIEIAVSTGREPSRRESETVNAAVQAHANGVSSVRKAIEQNSAGSTDLLFGGTLAVPVQFEMSGSKVSGISFNTVIKVTMTGIWRERSART